MEKQTKEKLVTELKEKFTKSKATFLADYQGIKAGDMTDFRKALRDASIEFKIARNTLAKRAIQGTEAEPFGEHLTGPTGFVFTYSDGAQAAKALTAFAKNKPAFKVRMGMLGARVIGAEEIKALSELPSKEELLGKMLGAMKAPMSGIVGVLSGVPRKLVYALNAVKEAKAAQAG